MNLRAVVLETTRLNLRSIPGGLATRSLESPGSTANPLSGPSGCRVSAKAFIGHDRNTEPDRRQVDPACGVLSRPSSRRSIPARHLCACPEPPDGCRSPRAILGRRGIGGSTVADLPDELLSSPVGEMPDTQKPLRSGWLDVTSPMISLRDRDRQGGTTGNLGLTLGSCGYATGIAAMPGMTP